MIDKEKFWSGFPFRPINQEKTDNINFILDKMNESQLLDLAGEYAYILATIKHETADTYRPITEMGSQSYLQGKKYYPYIGRGYVQLTWKWNYEKFGNLLGVDLVNNPDLAKDPETAWRVCELGMVNGLFTNHKLADYIDENGNDFVRARYIINGKDQRDLIAGYAQKFNNIIEFIN